MKLTDNEQRVIKVLIDDPKITNAELATRCHMALSTLNGTLIGLYRKYDIIGNGRAKRAILIDKLEVMTDDNQTA